METSTAPAAPTGAAVPGGAGAAPASPAALAGLRVLDLCGGYEQYAGKLFAQLGAEVILVEPVDGSRIRREGPFLHDRPHREHSLAFAYFNQGKRGICVDLDTADGQALLRQLAAGADLLISGEAGGVMQARGLGAEALRAVQPGLVTTNISLFGETGPYAHYQGDDLVAMALGGLLYLGGYPGQAPTVAHGQQGVLAAAQFAAVAALVAVWDVEGQPPGAREGQHLDVSVQESVAMALENSAQFVELENTVRKRDAGGQRQAGTGVFACRDGLVYLMAGGIASNRFWAGTVQWLVEEGAPGAARLGEPQWNEASYLATDEAKRIFMDVFAPFAATRTKAELYAEGQRRRLPICPVSTVADLPQSRQLQHRGYFGNSTAHPFSGSAFAIPGAPYGLSATPWQAGRPAPRLGEHTSEVLAALGVDVGEQAVLLRAGAIA